MNNEPGTIDEADHRMDTLKVDVASIQSQLHARRKPKGRNSPEAAAYRIWRRKAIASMRWKQSELAALKAWRRDAYRRLGGRVGVDEGVTGLLSAVCKITRRLVHVAGSHQLLDTEQATLDRAQAYLRSAVTGGLSGEGKEDTKG